MEAAKNQRLVQIDLLKAFAIFSVITLHSISESVFKRSLAPFHIWEAVPVFFILMGLNAAQSMSKLDEISSGWRRLENYAKNRFQRIILPYIIILILDIGIGFIQGNATYGPGILLGRLPVGLPGNYFVCALIQFTIIFPAIYWLFQRNPKATVSGSFLVSFAFEVLAPHVGFFVTTPFYYRAAMLRYLPAIALGLWIYKDMDVLSRKNRFILVGAIGSVAYLAAVSLFGYTFPLFFPSSNTPYMLSFFYPALLVLAGIKYLPKSGFRTLALIGRMSYHIYLVQMIFIAFVPVRDLRLPVFGAVAFNAAATISLAYAFYFLDIRYKKPILGFLSRKWMKLVPLLTSLR